MKQSHGLARCLCSELVTVHWVNEFGHKREVVANLEEIWSSGARLQLPGPVRRDTELRIACRKVKFLGRVSTCSADFIGFFVDVQFEDGCEWSRELYEPDHFFDPRSLLPDNGQKQLKEKNAEQLAECCKDLDPSLV